jgi:hypothetical protein
MSYMKPYASDHVFDTGIWDNDDARHNTSVFDDVGFAQDSL